MMIIKRKNVLRQEVADTSYDLFGLGFEREVLARKFDIGDENYSLDMQSTPSCRDLIYGPAAED